MLQFDHRLVATGTNSYPVDATLLGQRFEQALYRERFGQRVSRIAVRLKAVTATGPVNKIDIANPTLRSLTDAALMKLQHTPQRQCD